MKRICKYLPFVFFGLLVVVFFWKVFLKSYVPFPGDLLVGAYLPWLEYKWGYPAGVPVKNPLISDVFSQFYIWKSLVGEAWKNLQVPLWNPYSYSGYPLMANFHSGVFYPLNLIYLLLGDVRGWSFLVMFPSFGTAVTMYLFLREIKIKKLPALTGAVIYAFSGFAISWAQFITAAQAMIWLPLLLLFLEKYFSSKRVFYAYWIPVVFFMIVTSGHFQVMVYSALLTGIYFVWKWLEEKDWRMIWHMILPVILTAGLAMIQMLPTLELSSFGLRFSENIIAGHNYGLLPIKNLITILAPDYFGNPATGNFFGYFNYHETLFYCGAIGIFAIIASLFLLRNKYVRFFLALAIFSFLMGFDTFLGKSIYQTKVPGLSTSDAGRIAVLFVFSIGVLTANFLSSLEKINWKKIIFIILGAWLSYGAIWYLTIKNPEILNSTANPTLTITDRQRVAMRNLILPGGLLLGYSGLLLFAKKRHWVLLGVACLTAVEMFRFGWKYIPFVPEKFVYPDTPVTDFIKEKSKNEVFRIERERAELMPPATWMAYRFMSASGYDPMARADYVNVFQEEINGNMSGLISRYSEPERYDATALGKFNVKYLLAVKRTLGRIGGNEIIYSIDLGEWKKVFETDDVAVFENSKYQPRVRFLEGEGEAEIVSYEANKVEIVFENGGGKTLMLADSWYPGWKAYVNGHETEITKCEKIFRCVSLSDDEGRVVFSYEPESFKIGAIISAISAAAIIGGLVITKRKRVSDKPKAS